MSTFKKGHDERRNKGGRPKGSRSVIPSNKAIQDAFLKETLPTLEKLLQIRDKATARDSDVAKVSFKILDVVCSIMVERDEEGNGKATLEKGKEKGKENTAPTTGAVFQLTAVKNTSNK